MMESLRPPTQRPTSWKQKRSPEAVFRLPAYSQGRKRKLKAIVRQSAVGSGEGDGRGRGMSELNGTAHNTHGIEAIYPESSYYA